MSLKNNKYLKYDIIIKEKYPLLHCTGVVIMHNHYAVLH